MANGDRWLKCPNAAKRKWKAAQRTLRFARRFGLNEPKVQRGSVPSGQK